MKDLLKKSSWTDILMDVLFAIIGIFMIANADFATKIISYILGGIFCVYGVIRLIDYFRSKGNNDFYNYDLAYGIIAIIIGLMIIIFSNEIESLFRIMIGAWIIYSGILRLTLSLKLHNAKVSIWIVSLILSIIMIVGGIFMLFQNGAIVLTMGIIILIYSIVDIIESVIFMKYLNKLSKD